MATYNWASAVSGDWYSSSNWSPNGGPVTVPPFDSNPYGPEVTDSAVFDTGSKKPYTVTGGGPAVSLTVAHDNVTFANIRGGDGLGQSTFNVDEGARVTLAANSAIVMNGRFGGNDGTLSVNDATFIDKGIVNADLDFGKGARIVVDGPKAVMGGATSELDKGSVLTIEHGGSFADGGTIYGTVNLDGPKTILAGYTELGAGAVLHIHNAQVGGSAAYQIYTPDVTASGGLYTVAEGASVVGNGTIYPALGSIDGPALNITNNGWITASGGTLKILGPVVGNGTLNIAPGSTLELGGNSSNDVVFLNQATLLIDKGVQETGFLREFGVGDKVELAGQAITSETSHVSGPDTVLDLYDGSSMTDQLTFEGHFTPREFDLAKDGSGGTLVMLDQHSFHGVVPIC